MTALAVVVTLSCVLAAGRAPALPAPPIGVENEPVAGTWRGKSLCAGDRSSCVDETVVYYVRDIPEKPGRVWVQADKIVDGGAITMGSGEWEHDAEAHTLAWRMPRQVWLLTITGNKMEGTLTLADKTVFRRMTLKKDD